MSTPDQQCPCGSKKTLVTCCQPIHQQPSRAQHPEQLMRARYSAHVLGLVDFVVATYHPSCEAEQYREAIAESVHSHWLGLEVISSEVAENGEGYVEFKAYYQENEDEFCLHEKSRFLREPVGEECQWFYIDGEYPQPAEEPAPVTPAPASSDKVGRNDPCPCGSGKKFKKCCG
ncbi:YchJ family metal-binding protein [Photobacterium sp. OFAV2-7]|uniref:YchJ family metal-binding protein n=1 Tax=Photobacterium sp. OFAV2-7 TaxID=2917748 RepID=UPI001EF50A36|nr:YchJ family metal-binding protein [Photobacterium sp. OFAV2-7]MCG7587222.1 SEC-C domain-containing protein [Photobacterium sp. OFAV2-7]